MSLAFSTLRRKITIPEGKTVMLQPPTVGQTISILEALRNLEDQDDIDLLFELLNDLGWSDSVEEPLRKMVRFDPQGFNQFIEEILMQGYSEPEEAEDTDEDMKWNRLLSTYCRVFGESAITVWNEVPFPFFMERCKDLERADAVQKLRDANIAMYAMGGSEDQLNEWQQAANDEEIADKVTDISEAQHKRNKEVLKRLRNIDNGINEEE